MVNKGDPNHCDSKAYQSNIKYIVPVKKNILTSIKNIWKNTFEL